MSESDDDHLDRVAAMLPVHNFLIEVLLANMLRDNGRHEVEAFVETLKSVFAEGEVPAGTDEHHAVRISDVRMQSEAVLDQLIARVRERLDAEEREGERDPVAAARAWVRVGFEGAREDGLDMRVVAEEAVIRAMAVLVDRDVETVRGEAAAIVEDATDRLQARLDAAAARRPKPKRATKTGTPPTKATGRRASSPP